MATYAIGDVQGCLNDLLRLLERIKFDPVLDQLWFAGDLVSRGHDSLGVLRLIKSLEQNAVVVLGNHDLHLLAADAGHKKIDKKDELSNVLHAEDRKPLMKWLRSQPLVHYDKTLDTIMVHAGIPPIWSLHETLSCASEVESVLQSKQCHHFLGTMYGDQPDTWHEKLKGDARLRLITNYLTRMRFCTKKGRLELKTKASAKDAPKGYAPWFSHQSHKCTHHRIVFGHWAALMGDTGSDKFVGLDTGCVWGGRLTAYRLEDATFFSVAAHT